MSLLDPLMRYFRSNPAPLPTLTAPTIGTLLPGESPPRTTEAGFRTTPEQQLELMYLRMEPSFVLRNTINEIREMDQRDPRVKKIHERTARAACKGGLMLKVSPQAETVKRLWDNYHRRLELLRREKLESDMRGALMEGNLPIQWVIDLDSSRVIRGVRMPTETIKPLVGANGQFEDPAAAYQQWDWLGGKAIAKFPLWQLNLVRIRPDNYDNWGSFGRPYLDATRTVWRQLVMTERDLVVRRHTRAPQRQVHVLEGATDAELQTYEQNHRSKQGLVTTDYYLNRKGGVTGIAGDAELDQIADVSYLLDTFFSGAPAPKALFGYLGDTARDVLADLKQDYFDELDALQDNVSFIYELGFRLELLLHGINPDAEDFSVQFAERKTDTPNQRADLALKHQALGVPRPMVWSAAGLDPSEVQKHIDAAGENYDPYPGAAGGAGRPQPRVSITPGNRPKGESATSVSNT